MTTHVVNCDYKRSLVLRSFSYDKAAESSGRIGIGGFEDYLGKSAVYGSAGRENTQQTERMRENNYPDRNAETSHKEISKAAEN